MEIFTSWQTWEQAAADLPDPLAARLEPAAKAAIRWHGDQQRPTGVPYLEHLLEALEALARGAGVTDPEILEAVLLHDTVEDTAATGSDIEAEFGPVVAELVDWVTKPPAGNAGRDAKRAAKVAYLRRLADAPPEAKLVKLADRVSNVQRLWQMPPDYQRQYYAQTITYVMPLAAGLPFFEDWFAAWRREFAGLAG
jgi:(p)ppGpp synthase/HD superfamily hydrolase